MVSNSHSVRKVFSIKAYLKAYVNTWKVWYEYFIYHNQIAESFIHIKEQYTKSGNRANILSQSVKKT